MDRNVQRFWPNRYRCNRGISRTNRAHLRCDPDLGACRRSFSAAQYDGKTVFIEIGTLYGPPNVVAESRFVAVFDLSDPYRPVQLPSIPVGAGNDTREHALTGDGKLLLVPNSLDNSVSVIDIGLRQVVRTIATVTKPFRVEIKIKEATALCNSDKYSEGYTVTAKLARFIGDLEARKGIAPVL